MYHISTSEPDFESRVGFHTRTLSHVQNTADFAVENGAYMYGEASDKSRNALHTPRLVDVPRLILHLSLVDVVSIATHLEPFAQDYSSVAMTVNPIDISRSQAAKPGNSFTNLNQTLAQSMPPRIPANEAHNHNTGFPCSASQISTLQSSREAHDAVQTCYTRHAANQHHCKTRKTRRDSSRIPNSTSSPSEVGPVAISKLQHRREKNKGAAAKYRSRQRKQVQSMQEKAELLGEANAKLKAIVNDLKGGLIGLRAVALGHQGCGCRVQIYNYGQARVVSEQTISDSRHFADC